MPMFTKIKNLIKSPFWQQFRDTRAIGLVAFAVIAVLVTWSAGKAVQKNYTLQKQISELKQQNDIKKLENENLRLSNQYYETDRFLELAARRHFGKALPGETVLFVPKSVALANSKNLPQISQAREASKATEKPAYQRNFQKWIDFFLHR
jgi:cell division protein FtsB